MKLQTLPFAITICKISSLAAANMDTEFCFIAKTEREISLVCKTEDAPNTTEKREDGWKGFFIGGILDFSLTGILSKISTLLADNNISIFAVSTYDTDYIFVKAKDFERALSLLAANGHSVHEAGEGF